MSSSDDFTGDPNAWPLSAAAPPTQADAPSLADFAWQPGLTEFAQRLASLPYARLGNGSPPRSLQELFDPNHLYGLPDPATDHFAGAPSWQSSDRAGSLGASHSTLRFLDDWLASRRDAPPSDGGLSTASGLRASGGRSSDGYPRPEPTEYVYTHIGLRDPTGDPETQGDASAGAVAADDTGGSAAPAAPPPDASSAASASAAPEPTNSSQASDPDLNTPDLDWGSRAQGDAPSTDYWPLIPRMLQLDLDRNKEIAAQDGSKSRLASQELGIAPPTDWDPPPKWDDEQGAGSRAEELLGEAAQSALDLIPGRYYGRLAAEQLHAGNYGAAAAYEAAALADVALVGGAAALGRSFGRLAGTWARAVAGRSAQAVGGASQGASDLARLRGHLNTAIHISNPRAYTAPDHSP
jgi:hypothetical protein